MRELLGVAAIAAGLWFFSRPSAVAKNETAEPEANPSAPSWQPVTAAQAERLRLAALGISPVLFRAESRMLARREIVPVSGPGSYGQSFTSRLPYGSESLIQLR